LVADSHYKKGDVTFLHFLEEIYKNPPPQLILLGDIFHLLLPFEYLIQYNKEAIELINKISEKTEVYYTYGNHDFNIELIFPKVKFADFLIDNEKKVILSHGDLTDIDKIYKIYVRIIRSIFLNRVLNIISLNFINGWLFNTILRKKIKCGKIAGFKQKVALKVADIDFKIIIEGHYHQGGEFEFGDKKYFNLQSFFCKKKYYIYENTLKELTYGNG